MKTTLDMNKFIDVVHDLPMKRFDSIQNLDLYLESKLGYDFDLQKASIDVELSHLDNKLVSNCTIDGEDYCYLDIYYLIDNGGNLYITEVGMDFNT